MKTAKKYCIIFLLLVFILFFSINFYAIELKMSKDFQFLEIVLPTDMFEIDEFRQVDVWVVDLEDAENWKHISTQARKYFRSCYWATNNDLWIDGDGGIVMYQYENAEWREYPVIDIDNEMVTCKNGDAEKFIDLELIPQAIKERLIK